MTVCKSDNFLTIFLVVLTRDTEDPGFLPSLQRRISKVEIVFGVEEPRGFPLVTSTVYKTILRLDLLGCVPNLETKKCPLFGKSRICNWGEDVVSLVPFLHENVYKNFLD